MAEIKEKEVIYRERKRVLFFGLPWTFTKYTIYHDMITVDSGFLRWRRMTVICTRFRT